MEVDKKKIEAALVLRERGEINRIEMAAYLECGADEVGAMIHKYMESKKEDAPVGEAATELRDHVAGLVAGLHKNNKAKGAFLAMRYQLELTEDKNADLEAQVAKLTDALMGRDGKPKHEVKVEGVAKLLATANKIVETPSGGLSFKPSAPVISKAPENTPEPVAEPVEETPEPEPNIVLESELDKPKKKHSLKKKKSKKKE